MSLLDSFGKPRWEHDDPEVRLSAVTELEDQEILLALAENDPDEGVRAGALARITGSEALDKFADTLPEPLKQQAREQRLRQLLPDDGELASVTDDAILLRIAGLSDNPDLVNSAIGRLQGSDVRMDAAINHPVARVRLCAAEGIEDITMLQDLMHQAKHRDKSVFLHCKKILDEHHSARKQEAERRAELEALSEASRTLSTAVDSPEYKNRYLSLERRWKAVKEYAGPEEEAQIQSDLNTCLRRIEQLAEARAAEEAQENLAEEAGKSFEGLIAELEALNPAELATMEPAGVRELGENLNRIEEEWVLALPHAQPSREQTKTCKEQLKLWREMAQTMRSIADRKSALGGIREELEKVDRSDYLALQKVQKRIEKLIKALKWPEPQLAATPRPILDLHEQLDELNKRFASLKQEEKKTLERLEVTFAELRKELDEAHFKNADRAHNRIRNLLRHLGPEQQKHFQHELAPLSGRLREIHDWQGFAVEPKKVELCERMAALVSVEEDPDTLAGRIKALQDEWKTLGAISPRRDQTLWKRFHAAAEQAYAPCKQAFALQADLRKQNVRARMELIAQLVEYEKRMAWPDAEAPDPDSPRPDWKMVQKTLDTAREAFNNIKPVDRKGERKSRNALKRVCDRIYGHIRNEYEKNIELKKDMVARARELVELEDLRAAIDGAKSIQREWKEVGMTPMKVDRRLWKDFRGACDAVFARLHEQRHERNAAMEERKKLAEERKRKEQERWPRLLDRMRACSLKEEKPKKAKKLWEKDGDIAKGVDTTLLDDYWQQGPNGETPEDKLQTACIALEVFAGVDSPPEDKEARMAYQMARLVEGMGMGQSEGSERLLELINEFITLRPPAKWMERYCQGIEGNL